MAASVSDFVDRTKFDDVNPTTSYSKDYEFPKVFAEVKCSVLEMFKNDDVVQKLHSLLTPLHVCTNLLPCFMLIEVIIDNLKKVLHIDGTEYRTRLECLNRQLAQNAIDAAEIVRCLEDYSKCLIDVMKSDKQKQVKMLESLDAQSQHISNSLEKCDSDMESFEKEMDKFKASLAGQTSADSSESTSRNDIQECFENLEANWQQLHEILKTLQKDWVDLQSAKGKL